MIMKPDSRSCMLIKKQHCMDINLSRDNKSPPLCLNCCLCCLRATAESMFMGMSNVKYPLGKPINNYPARCWSLPPQWSRSFIISFQNIMRCLYTQCYKQEQIPILSNAGWKSLCIFGQIRVCVAAVPEQYEQHWSSKYVNFYNKYLHHLFKNLHPICEVKAFSHASIEDVILCKDIQELN